MSRAQKKKAAAPTAQDAMERMQALYGQGATREARALAAGVLADPEASEDARALARQLLQASSIDPRALLFAGIAGALAALYVIRFLLMG